MKRRIFAARRHQERTLTPPPRLHQCRIRYPFNRRLQKISLKAVREREGHYGLWVIHSNGHDLSAEDLALAYKQLVRVEEAWRTMKSIEIRPVFHRTPERIRAHVFLCVLALLLESVAEQACGETWPRIREELRTIKVGQ